MIPLVHLERVCRQKFTHIDLAAVDGVELWVIRSMMASAATCLSNESSGAPQNERKLPPSVLSRGPGTGQRGAELAQLSVSFVRPYSRIFRENLRVL